MHLKLKNSWKSEMLTWIFPITFCSWVYAIQSSDQHTFQKTFCSLCRFKNAVTCMNECLPREVRYGGTVRWYDSMVHASEGTVRWYGTVVWLYGTCFGWYGTMVRYGGAVHLAILWKVWPGGEVLSCIWHIGSATAWYLWFMIRWYPMLLL